jgi:hypothetical protein
MAVNRFIELPSPIAGLVAPERALDIFELHPDQLCHVLLV